MTYWTSGIHDRFIPAEPDIATVTEVEMDENQKYYDRKTIGHRSEKLIGFALGHRDTQTLVKMYDSNIYSDRYESYKKSFPQIS